MRGRRARSGTGLIVVGVSLGLAGLAVLVSPDEPVVADVGSLLEQPVAQTSSAPTSSSLRGPTAPASSMAPAASARSTGFVPERLLVEALDIDAPLVTTVVDTEGALVPPEDPAQLGWWRGVRPGEGEGSVVVAGHIDSRRFGQGPLAQVVELDEGDRAVLVGSGGESAEYVVRGIQTFPKDAFPASDLFSTSGSERLVLVTCGGTFDPDRGGWDSNVVAVLDPTA